MQVHNKILSKKPSDNTATRTSSFIKNDNIKSAHKSSKFNSASDIPQKHNSNNNSNISNNNSFYEALNMILQNKNTNTNTDNNSKNNGQLLTLNKNKIKEFSFDSLNTSEFDNKEMTMEHISTPIEKNIIKSGNILMKIVNKNNKNKSELPNIVELAEEDIISINSKDTNKTTIVSNNCNNINIKNAFFNAKKIINENTEQNLIFNFIKNKYETSIKKNKNNYVKLTPIKKNKIKKNIINNNKDYYELALNLRKKNKLRESDIKQIHKKLIFEDNNKNYSNHNIEVIKNFPSNSNSYSNSGYEKEQIIFDKSINYTEIIDGESQNDSYIDKKYNGDSTELDKNTPKTILKLDDTQESKYIYNDNYDKDFSNNTLYKGYLNIFDDEIIKKEIFLNNTLENKKKKFERYYINNYNSYNTVENFNKRNRRKKQYLKYKNKVRNAKTINENDKNKIDYNYFKFDKEKNNNSFFKIKEKNNKYFNYNLYENLLNTDKLTSLKYNSDDISLLKLKIDSYQTKRIILFSIICSLCEKFKYKRETFHLTISLIDGYLYNLIKNKNENENYSGQLIKLDNNLIILICLSCLFICSKIEEIKYMKPISYIRALYENDYMQKYFQNNINTIKVNKIILLEEKIMTLLKWKIYYVNINTWLNWYICQWDLFIDTVELVKNELINNYGEQNIFYFEKKNEQAYYNYRLIHQLIGIIKFDLDSLLYDNKILVLCAVFLCIENYYNKINKTNKAYKSVFNNFIKFNINENIIINENYINTMKYCKELIYKFLENNLYNFDLPIFFQTNNIQDTNNNGDNKQSYEDFLSFQTFNKNIPIYLKQITQKEDDFNK